MDTEYSLKKALENEKIGHDMYKEAAKNSSNEKVKDLFNYLAEQELAHIKKIEEYADLHVDLNEEYGENISHFDDAVQLFKRTVSEWKAEFKQESDLEALRKALEFEKEGYEYYKAGLEETQDKKLEEFYKFLMKEEDLHYHFIQNTLNYLENPEQYNQEEEDWFFEG